MPILDGRMRAAYGQSVNVISTRERPELARFDRLQPLIGGSIDARGGARCCRSMPISNAARAGTDMTAQIEAVDFFAFDNSYARPAGSSSLRCFRQLPSLRPV